MTFTEALRIARGIVPGARPFEIVLACGFTPLHLQTFLCAHVRQRMTDRGVRISTGLFGDVAGTVEAVSAGTDALAVALEWSDLDPRLGFREATRWAGAAADILVTVRGKLERLRAAFRALPAGVTAALCMPSLPLPPLFHTRGDEAGDSELCLTSLIAAAAADFAQDGVAVVNSARLAETSPARERYCLKSDLITGLPYSMGHVDAVASALGALLLPPAPKKGIITALDDTLWSGIVGDAGWENVCWGPTGVEAVHGVYQRLLAALADDGVLIAVASKNDPAQVQKAFEREDILIGLNRLFPLEVHWNAKSASVERVLRAWNVGADSVIFVDDSPMELAEVAAAHPAIECIQFPRGDCDAALAMFRRLRDLCGKHRLSGEDRIRGESLRRASEFREMASAESASEDFLRGIDARISFDWLTPNADPRILELVNKTNQFNLNGIRHEESEWTRALEKPGAMLAVVAYEDRFGPLGRIAVVRGRREAGTLHVDVWVMSCRAFARRIEHQCIQSIFDRYDVDRITFEYKPTARNGPLQQFFSGLSTEAGDGCLALSRSEWEKKRPALTHQVT